jgi:predicted unusual protein kinase regulating ubiquinone biosynthesis (AarF/ABC1/UbiB family)
LSVEEDLAPTSILSHSCPVVEKKSLPRGRLRRLSKLAGMGAKIGKSLVGTGVRRVFGDDSLPTEAAEKVFATLGELKGAAMKVGQAVSMAADGLPPEMRDVVSRLFSQAPALPFPEIKEVVERELGAPIEQRFQTFSQEPMAAASLGQVHRATTRDGAQVAVKVQYPGVAEALEDDLKNAGLLAKALGTGLRDARDYYDEVRREVSAELDYGRELAFVEDYRRYLAPWPDLVVPHVYRELSSSRVLTLELLEGPTLGAYLKTAREQPLPERNRIGEQLERAVYTPFLLHGVIHADTHPGNFVVMSGSRLGVLDFGSIKHFSVAFWRCYKDALTAGLEGEHPDLLELTRSGGFRIELEPARARALLEEVAHIVSKPLHGPYDWASDTIIEELRALKGRRMLDLMKVRPPPEAVMFFRSIGGVAYNMRALGYSGDLRPVFAPPPTPPHPRAPLRRSR